MVANFNIKINNFKLKRYINHERLYLYYEEFLMKNIKT